MLKPRGHGCKIAPPGSSTGWVGVTAVTVAQVGGDEGPEAVLPPTLAPLVIAANVDVVLVRFIEQSNQWKIATVEKPEMPLNLLPRLLEKFLTYRVVRTANQPTLVIDVVDVN